MSSAHVVVVWEWQRDGLWLPHGAGVARALERAHGKRLTRLALADADPDPSLRHHAVNLRTLTQTDHEGEGGRVWRVRRAVYSVQSPAARGVSWGWAGGDVLPMELQCRLEHAWRAGTEVRWAGWRAAPAPQRMAALHDSGALRALRRCAAPPYPLARAPPPAPPPRAPLRHPTATLQCGDRETRAPPGPTGPAPAHATNTATSRAINHATGFAPASPRDRKPGLARQILHNLNIFRDTRGGAPSDSDDATETETETKAQAQAADEDEDEADRTNRRPCDELRARRHSVDTVSTYLSHESKDGDQRASVSSLLNCSGGSDDVFEQPAGWPAPTPAPTPTPTWGAQPAGSMSWRVQPVALPHCAAERSLLVSYSFQSGVQGAEDPSPGAPYYAVGFPRHTLLPDCALGHAVLVALRRCWSARALFVVRASRTTGREHVLAWRVAPPPADVTPYTTHHPERLLRAALQRLTRLLPPAEARRVQQIRCCSSGVPRCVDDVTSCPERVLCDCVGTC